MGKINLSNVFFAGPEHRPFVMTPEANRLRGSALLRHGFLGTPAEMRPLGSLLATDGWLAYGPLLPGSGPDISRLGQMERRDWVQAAFTAGATLRRRARPLLLIGYSMGAAIALHIAEALRADLLVLLAPFWKLGDWRAYPLSWIKYLRPELAPLARADFENPQLRQFLNQIAPELALDDEATRTALREEVLLPTAVLGELLHLGREGYRAAGTTRAPALVIQGREDELVKPAATRKLVVQHGGPVSYHEIGADHDFPKKLREKGAGDVASIITEFIERSLCR